MKKQDDTSARIEERRIDLRDASNYARGMLEWLQYSRQRITDLTKILPSSAATNGRILS